MPKWLEWLLIRFTYPMHLFSLGSNCANVCLWLRFVEVLSRYSSSCEVSGLFGSNITPSLTVIAILIFIEFFPGSIGIRCGEWFVLYLLHHIGVLVNHVQFWMTNVVVKVNWFLRIHVCMNKIGLRLPTSWEKRLKDPVRASRIQVGMFSWPWLVLFITNVLISRELFNIHSILIIMLLLLLRHILLIESHDGCWLMLLPHHFNSFLSAIQVKPVVLFLLLNLQILKAIILWVDFPILDTIGFLHHAWQMEIAFFGRSIVFSTLGILLLIMHFTHAVLHENEMRILIWPLLCLSLLNSLVQEAHSFFVLFFKFGFYAFILHILKPVHLELGHCWVFQVTLTKRVLVPCCISETCLSNLPLLSEFNIVFVKNDLLNIVSGHLSHEKALHIAFFVALHYFVFKTEELQNLLEHSWSDWAFNIERLRHLWGCLLSVYLNTFGSISKLIKLSKNLGSLLFEFLLENFHGLLIIQLFASHNPILIAKQGVNLIKKVLGWSRRMLEVHVNACFWEMAQH